MIIINYYNERNLNGAPIKKNKKLQNESGEKLFRYTSTYRMVCLYDICFYVCHISD